MNGDKGEYKHKRLMNNIFLMIIVILLIMELGLNMSKEYIFINRVVCLSISILVFIMSIVRVENKNLGILKFLGIGYLSIASVRFLDIELSHFISDNISFVAVNQMIVYFEMLNVILSMILYYNNFKEKYQWINTILIIAITIISFKYRVYILEDLLLIFTIEKGVIINQIIISILFIIIIALYNYYKVGKKGKWLIELSFLCLLSNSFFNIHLLGDLNFILFICMSKLISYFILYNKFEEELLSNAYSSAYENLKTKKEIKKSLNKKLKVRQAELEDLNLLLKKSESKYFELVKAFSNCIIIFENDVVIHSNYSKNKCCNIKDELENNESLTLNKILSKVTGKDYSKERDINEFSEEVKIITDDGEEKHLEILLMKIYDNSKILIFNDITDIIKRREEIIKIEKKIKEENMKDEFYANISHELRTPINVIYSALQLNDVYLNSNQIYKINDNNKVIKQNCLRLIRTINNFIDSNKIADGYLEMDCKVYNLVSIIENLILACDFYMNLKNTKLTYDPQHEEVFFCCDKAYMERIILNILSNSLKYGKDNGNIYVSIRIDDNRIIIEVINDAEAIPENKRNEIFDKFTKINTSLSRPSEGSGLGLYVTKGLVELHGGEISINAGIKYGNIFKIILPYDKNVKGEEGIVNNTTEMNFFGQKIDIEFSDIYF